jgi:Putative zinc- or iron-chelating domain
MIMRTCGIGKDKCSLCCRLLPIASESHRLHIETIEAAIRHGMMTRAEAVATVSDFAKPAGERCPHQRLSKGCAIYKTRPFGCRFWNCRWLVNDDTGDLSRPDRSHYVIDVSPDYVTSSDGQGRKQVIPVVQIWVDPDYPDVYRTDQALRAYLVRRAHKGWGALIRMDAREAFFVCAPPMTVDGQWYEQRTLLETEVEHTVEQKMAALGPITVVI